MTPVDGSAATKPEPHDLWQQAWRAHPSKPRDRDRLFRELMVVNGYSIDPDDYPEGRIQ